MTTARELLEAELEVLELEVLVAEHRHRARLSAGADLEQAGRELARRHLLAAPARRRELFPHERLLDFDALEEAIDETRETVGRMLVDDRGAFAELLEDELAQAPTGDAVIGRLEELSVEGIGTVDRVPELIEQRSPIYRAVLAQAALAAALRVRREAAAQRAIPRSTIADLELPFDPDLEERLDRQAFRLATAPHVDAVKAAREAAITAGARDRLAAVRAARQAVDEMSERALDDYANTASIGAEGTGREGGVRTTPVPERIYASELLDSNTCVPCSHVDGTEYASLEESLEDYPEGRYRHCEGGPRCRGTRVFVWAEGDEDEGPPPPRPPRAPEPAPPQAPPPEPEPEPEPEPPAEEGDVVANRRLDFDTPQPLPGDLSDYVDVDLKGITPAGRDEYVDVVSRLATEYPDVFAELGYVGTSQGVYKLAGRKRTPGGVLGVAIDRIRARGLPNGIGLNASRVSSPAKLAELKADTIRQVEAGWFSNIADEHAGVRSVMTHEFGHLVYYRIKRDDVLRRRWKDRVEELLAEQGIVIDATTAVGAKARYEASRQVGRYATSNDDELFAESFASWKLGDNPAPMARAIGQATDELLKGGLA